MDPDNHKPMRGENPYVCGLCGYSNHLHGDGESSDEGGMEEGELE